MVVISIKVFIKTINSDVVAIDSENNISDLSNWTEIDEGSGDKYSHAQANYLDEPLLDDSGRFRYLFANGLISKKTEDELLSENISDTFPSKNDRILALESAILDLIIGGVV